MARRVSSREFVGRDEELGVLTELVARAAEAQGGAVVVTGEAGVGKSRLVAELGRRAVEQGAQVLVGECVDLAQTELPYAPVVGALRGVVRDRGERELAALIGPARPELARLLPELGEPAPAAPDVGGQARLFELLLGVLSRLGREQPVLLVFEDLHWADSASLDLLGFLVRNQRAERLAMVLTFRSDELTADHPLRSRLAELERSGRAQRLELAPLSREEVAAQVAGITGAQPAAAVLDRLFERAEGNPFFTEELLAAPAKPELPGSLRDALLVRVQRLSEPARAVVGVTAVAGRTVDHRLLAAVSGMPEQTLINALRDAVANHVLLSDGLRYSFRHALLREAVYADLVAGERAPVHAALAAALAGDAELAGARATWAAEIAHHWSAGGAVEPALAASVQAATEAERMYAITEARRHYEHALELWDRVAEPSRLTGIARSELLRRAADAVFLAGDEPRAVTLAHAALEEPDMEADASRAAGVHGRLSTYRWGAGDSDGALRSARAAVALLPTDPPTAGRARALCAEGRILLMRGHNEAARQRCEESLSVARGAGARREEGEALNYLGGALAFLGDSEGAIVHLEDAVRILRETPSGARGCPEYENLSEILADAGQAERGLEVAREGVAVARELGVERSYGVVLLGRAAQCALALGRVQEAVALTEQALAAGRDSFFGFNALEARGRCELLRGDFAAADHHLEAVWAMATRMGDLMWIGPVAAVRSEADLWRGQSQRAVEIVDAALAIASEHECLQHTSELHANGARAHADLAQAARARGDAGAGERAAAAATALGERLDRIRASLPFHSRPARERADGALCAAEVGRARGSSDARLWHEAVEACDAFGHRPRAAYARLRQAEALIEHGDRVQAKRVLGDAAGAARALGHHPLGREIDALARRARIAISETAGTGAPGPPYAEFGLSGREVEVLHLLAEGLTNRQIAARLYISEKTAEHHVSRILGKLGVHTRGAAGAIAHRIETDTPART